MSDSEAYCPACTEWLYHGSDKNKANKAAEHHNEQTSHEVLVGEVVAVHRE